MDNLLTKVQEIKGAIENYDTSAAVELKVEERGYRLSQMLPNDMHGVMLFFRYETNKLAAFNNGWKLDKKYLASICDFIVPLLNEKGITTGQDCSTLYSQSKKYRNLA